MSYYVYISNKQLGPISKGEFRKLFESGTLKPTDKFFAPGMTTWINGSEAANHLGPVDSEIEPGIHEPTISASCDTRDDVLAHTEEIRVTAFCTQCGDPMDIGDRFCRRCGAATKERPILNKQNQSTSPAQPTPCNHDPESSAPPSKKPMHLSAYLALCFVALFFGAIAAGLISTLMGSAYAEAIIPSALGFWLGKKLIKNRGRDAFGIATLPAITLAAGFFGTTLGKPAISTNPQMTSLSGLIALAVSLTLSCILFGILKSRSIR